MRTLIAAASLVLATSAHAIPTEHYQLRNAGDLARICATSAAEPDATTAIAFCHGVLAGAYGYFVSVTPPAERGLCAPDPAPTRGKVAKDFVVWMKAHPQFNNDGAVDALFRYAAEAFPCKR
jgi:hypothetical protein